MMGFLQMIPSLLLHLTDDAWLLRWFQNMSENHVFYSHNESIDPLTSLTLLVAGCVLGQVTSFKYFLFIVKPQVEMGIRLLPTFLV